MHLCVNCVGLTAGNEYVERRMVRIIERRYDEIRRIRRKFNTQVATRVGSNMNTECFLPCECHRTWRDAQIGVDNLRHAECAKYDAKFCTIVYKILTSV